MSEPAIRAEIHLTLRDDAAAKVKAASDTITKSVNKVAEVNATAATKSAKVAEESASKSVAAVQAQHDSHIKLYKDIAASRETLGVRAERVIREEIHKTEAAYQQLARSGDASARELARAQQGSINKIRELRIEMGELSKMQRLQAHGQNAMPLMAAGTAGGVAGYGVTKAFVNKYAEQEQAFTELRISMTDKNNKVSGNYAKSLDIATELGNQLPGSTRDYVLEAQALKQKGMTESAIVNGGLKATGLLRVGMGLRGEGEAGELVAKEMHSFGLKDTELEGAADHTYRMHKAFGTKSAEIGYANQYMGGDLNMLGWTGMENMKKVQAMQGMMAMKGQDSSVFGTHFADMLKFAAQNQTRLKGNGAITKDVNETLGKHGIKLDFFDNGGKFVSPDGFLAQLEKLQKLSQKEQITVFHKLFGIGSDTAIALTKGGRQGVKEAEDKVDNTLSLTESVKQLTETFQGKKEALSGSVENMMAAAGEPVGEALKPILDKLNDFAGTATTFFQKNPLSATLAVLSASAVAATGAAGLVSMFLRGGVGLPVRVVNPGMGAAGGLPDKPGSTAGGAAGLLGKTLAVGAAADLGYNVIGPVVAGSIDKMITALTGHENTLGGFIFDALHSDTLAPKDKNESHVKIDLTVPEGMQVKSQKVKATGNTTLDIATGSMWGVPG